MKKIAAILIIAIIAAFGAVAENAVEELISIEGVVLEIHDDGYLINEAELGDVKVLLSEDTYIETNYDITVGDYVYIDYSGMMTRSLPPQITAEVLRMYKVEGDVTDANAEENIVYLSTIDFGDIIVNLPDAWSGVEFTETHMTAYFNGAMTMSLPAQIGAGLVIPGYSLQGVVTEITDEYIMLGEEMSAVQVNISEVTLPEDLAAGDAVTVIYDGMMTRSIPAQINASSVELIGADDVAPAAAETEE